MTCPTRRMIRPLTLTATLLLLLVTAPFGAAQQTDWELPDGVAIERVAADLFLPVNISFAESGSEPADPLFYLTELYGKVKVVTNDGTVHVYADSLLNFNPTGNFPGTGELGVIGIVVDTASRDLFVSMVYQDAGIKNKLVRMYSSPDGLRADSVVTLLDDIPGPSSSHQIQQVTIGPDRKVYVQIGDGLDRIAAADDDDLRGKVLRMNLDGTIPVDNPDSTSYVYAKGLRNPFGGTWRSSDSTLYVTDNGPESDDRMLRVKPGDDLGWPFAPTRDPIYLWNPTQSPTAMDFFTAEDLANIKAFPDSLDGRLFVALAGKTYRNGPTQRGKRIEVFELDGQGRVVSIDTLLQYVGTGFATVVGLAFGPDGLYFTDLYGEAGFDANGRTSANVYRIYSDRRATAIESEGGVAGSINGVAGSKALSVYPNPSRQGVDRIRISFELAEPARVSMRIFDSLGREALHVLDEFRGSGRHTVDIAPDGLSSGSYFCRLETSTGVIGRSFILMR